MRKPLRFAAFVLLMLTACGGMKVSKEAFAFSFPSAEKIAASQVQPSSQPPSSQAPSQHTGQPSAAQESFVPAPSQPVYAEHQEAVEMKWFVQAGGRAFTVTPESNDAAEALTEMLREAPLTIQMSDYAGFEKTGPLGASLPASDSQTTAQAGDIMLYRGNQIVLFYGSNSWSYTRLGRVDDLTGWKDALGGDDVTVSFSIGG